MAGSTSPAGRPARRTWACVAVVAILVVGCGSPVATSSAAPSPTAGGVGASAPVSTSSPAPTQAAAATAVATVVPSIAPVITALPVTEPPVTEPPVTAPPPSIAPAIGVALKIGDEQLMTVLAAESWPGTASVKPAKGKAFFTVSIRIDALALTSWDSADFKLRDAAGKAYAWRIGRSPHLYDGANMSIGNNYIGWITYEVPKASVAELTLVYKPGFLDGATFRVPLY